MGQRSLPFTEQIWRVFLLSPSKLKIETGVTASHEIRYPVYWAAWQRMYHWSFFQDDVSFGDGFSDVQNKFFFSRIHGLERGNDSNCWWFRNFADQLRLVAYPIIYWVLYIPGGAGFLPSTVWKFVVFVVSEELWRDGFQFRIVPACWRVMKGE